VGRPFGGTAAAITYADGGSSLMTVVVGALVAITTWAVAYAAEHR
jgi:hypothetical protein